MTTQTLAQRITVMTSPMRSRIAEMAQMAKSKFNVKTALLAAGSVALPLFVGFASAAITGDAMSSFGSFNQPPLSPPAWLFPVAWTALYILMGIASFFILRLDSSVKTKRMMIGLYIAQLGFNFAWSPVFFLMGAYWFALGWLVAMLAMVAALAVLVFKHSKAAFFCLVPYVAWCSFATYLNLGVALLN